VDVMRATLHDLPIPLINNADARPIQSAEELRVSLIKQLAASVLWEDSVRRLWDMGVRTLVEVGPGTVLCGLVKRIVPDARVLNVQDPASLASAIEALAA
jgi:[acyl-carrier-protein] S-malonyltransferase